MGSEDIDGSAFPGVLGCVLREREQCDGFQVFGSVFSRDGPDFFLLWLMLFTLVYQICTEVTDVYVCAFLKKLVVAGSVLYKRSVNNRFACIIMLSEK